MKLCDMWDHETGKRWRKIAKDAASTIFALLIFTLCLPCRESFAPVYKWTDEDGTPHYSDYEPGGRDYEIHDGIDDMRVPSLPSPSSTNSPSSRPTDSPNTSSNEMTPVRRLCLDKWPGNYRMQEYCLNQQSEAKSKLELLLGPPPIQKHILDSILIQCLTKWDENWRMVHYCTAQQIEAYQRVHGR